MEHVLLALLLLAVTQLAGVALGNLDARGLQKDVQLGVQVVLGDSQVPLEQEQQLLLHQVDLGAGEAKGVVGGVHVGVVGPVLVLGRAVVEVLGGQDQGGQEDAVGGASQAAGHGLQLGLEAVEVDQGRHESWDLDVGGDDQLGDELFQRGQRIVGAGDGPGLGASWWSGRPIPGFV